SPRPRCGGNVMARQAYAIVRQYLSGNATGGLIERIRRLALDLQLDLCDDVQVVDDDTDFGLLLATFEDSQITTLLLVSVVQVTGWLDAIRQSVDMVTLDPLMHWRRLHTARAQTSIG